MQLRFTLESISQAVQQALDYGKAYKVWAFHGEMGSGKTTFIHALCELLQVTSAIGSPTYAIINEYMSPVVGTIYHMDWYRLSGEDEALQAGVEDALFSNQLCLVEWPQKAARLLPSDTLHIHIGLLSTSERKLTIGAGAKV